MSDDFRGAPCDIYKFIPREGARTHLFSFKSTCKWKQSLQSLLLILQSSSRARPRSSPSWSHASTFRLPGRQGLTQLKSVKISAVSSFQSPQASHLIALEQ